MKHKRHLAILNLVAAQPVQTQQELTAGLAELGVETTQATVSRDIHELGLVRTKSGYKPGLFTDYIVGVTPVQFLTVIRTAVGCANLVARAIDESELPGVVGTLAGDDTIIVVHPDADSGAAFTRFVQ